MVRMEKILFSAGCFVAVLLACGGAKSKTLLRRPSLDMSIEISRKPDAVIHVSRLSRLVDDTNKSRPMDPMSVVQPLKTQLEELRLYCESRNLQRAEDRLRAFLDSLDSYYGRNMVHKETHGILKASGLRTLEALHSADEFKPDPTITYDRAGGVYMVTYKDEKLVWEPTTKIDAEVMARVHFDEENGWYVYEYGVTSHTTSERNIFRFLVSYEHPMSAFTSPSGWVQGLTSFRPLHSWAHITPATERGSQRGIPPGSRRLGFGFASYGLPGIVDCYAEGTSPLTEQSGEYSPEMVQVLKTFSSDSRRYVHGKTVGPVSFPDVDTPIQIIRRLSGYVGEARAIGWLGNEQVAQILREQLESVQKAFELKATSKATRLLREIIAYLAKKLSSADVEPEVADLFAVNVQWLIEGSERGQARQYLSPMPEELEFHVQARYIRDMLRECIVLGWIQDDCPPESQEHGSRLLSGLPPLALAAFENGRRARARDYLEELSNRISGCPGAPSDKAKHAIQPLRSTIAEVQDRMKEM